MSILEARSAVFVIFIATLPRHRTMRAVGRLPMTRGTTVARVRSLWAIHGRPVGLDRANAKEIKLSLRRPRQERDRKLPTIWFVTIDLK